MVLLIQEMYFKNSITKQLSCIDKNVLGFLEQKYGKYKFRI